MSTSIEVEHRRAGPLRIEPQDLLHFDYLPGFPNGLRFVLLAAGEDSLFACLVCIDDLDLLFEVTDPKVFFPDYGATVLDELATLLPGSSKEDLIVLAIANFNDKVPVLNLAAPLVFDQRTRHARQVIFDDERFPLRRALPGFEKPASEGEHMTPSQIESKPQR